MSDLHRTPTKPTARKPHVCIGCGAYIPKGEKYVQQEGFFEGEAYRNRYHYECWAKLSSSGDFDFSAFSLEIPERLREGARP